MPGTGISLTTSASQAWPVLQRNLTAPAPHTLKAGQVAGLLQPALPVLQLLRVSVVCPRVGNSLASIGGFCAGDREIVDHQRLSGLGYCFSASLPPYLAVAASGALQQMQEHPELLRRLRERAATMRRLLAAVAQLEVGLGSWRLVQAYGRRWEVL